MKVLNLSLDKALFTNDSDSIKRMAAYSELAEKTIIIVFNRVSLGKFKKTEYSDKLVIIPTNSINRWRYFFDCFKIVKNIKKNQKLDLVIAQDSFLTGFIGYRLSIACKSKLLVGVFGTDIFNRFWLKEKLVNRLLKIIGLRTLLKADAIQTDNPETFKFLKAKYGDKVFWKPIIPAEIENYRLSERTTSKSVRILSVARLVKQKNLPMMFRVIERLIKMNLDKAVEFTLVGFGPLEKYTEKQIAKFESKIKINWIKGCEWKELINYYLNNDIFILTSFYEGFPRVFQEAGAVGLPVVTTPVSQGLIKDGLNGYIVPHERDDLFAERLSELINNPETLNKMGNEAKKYFWDNFDFQITLKIQEEIYNYLKK